MTDPDGGVERPYSKDYWDNVIREIGRRPSITVSAVLLALIYATAIYAPLLANDRPLVLDGTDYGAYRKARTTLAPIAMSLESLSQEGPDTYNVRQVDRLLPTAEAAVRGRISSAVTDQAIGISGNELDAFIAPWNDGVEAALVSGDFSKLKGIGRDVAKAVSDKYPDVRTNRITQEAGVQIDALREERRSWEQVVDLEREAFVLRAETMKRFLAAEDTAALDALEVSVQEFCDELAAASNASSPQLVARAAGIVDETKEVRTALRAQKADGTSTSGVPLRSTRSYPALSALSGAEVYFMVLWLLVLTWPLWNAFVNRILLGGSRHRIRVARKAKILTMALLPLLPALAWAADDSGDLFISGYKKGLTDGTIVATTAIFAPVPYGRAEQNDSEVYRPPTWSDDSSIGEDGFYETGPRAPRDDMAEGTQPVSQPVEINYAESTRNAPLRRIFGTDSLGRDLLARMIWGGRISLSVGLVAAAFMVILGTIIGSIAGYVGGWTDIIISRIIEVFQCFPVLFFAMVIVAFLGPGIFNIMVVLGLLRWTTTARLARGEFIRLRDQEFVVASEALGVSNSRTIFRHVLPNALGPILVSFTFAVATGILVESSLSFLGFGIQLPIPSWGSLLQESRSAEHWWIQVFTGFAIFITILLYNLLGEGLRDALDPRQKAR